MLLDFGQCKALTADRQAALARLVIAMDRGWPLGVVQAMQAGSCNKMFVPCSHKALPNIGTVVCCADLCRGHGVEFWELVRCGRYRPCCESSLSPAQQPR